MAEPTMGEVITDLKVRLKNTAESNKRLQRRGIEDHCELTRMNEKIAELKKENKTLKNEIEGLKRILDQIEEDRNPQPN